MIESTNKKSLKDISWNVSEEIYRADNALSYSKLAQFFRQGPNALISNEKIDTPSLRFGSCVDTILTAPEEFDDRFYVADIDKFSDTIRKIVEDIYGFVENVKEDDDSLDTLDDLILLNSLDKFEYQTNWKPETRIKKLIELGSDYYTVLKYSTGKTVISPQEFSEASQCVQTLKTHPFTYQIFECNEDEEIFYQLKFKTTIEDCDNSEVRIMTDCIKINHKEKWIQIYDLKTTGKDEEKFEESFDAWNYWIQAGLYEDVVDLITSADDYFSEFNLLPFKFIVINKVNLRPIVWDTVNYKHIGIQVLKKYGVKWQTLLKDANWHLKNGKFDYSRKSYENNGCNPIILKL